MKEYILKYNTLGYKKGLDVKKFSVNYEKSLKEISSLVKSNSIENVLNDLPACSIDEVKEKSKLFLKNNFDIHDVAVLDSTKNLDIFASDTPKIISEKVDRIVDDKMVNPFDLPLNLVEGHSMVGQLKKICPIIPGVNYSLKRLPMDAINIGNHLSQLSIATYIHEITHSQMESNIGYCEDYHNKEVITIFMEKVAALDLDSTGELLRKSDLARLIELKSNLSILCTKNNCLAKFFDEESLLESSMRIESTFKAMKLFDLYLSLNKSKKRLLMLNEINKIFNNETNVEDVLDKYKVTTSNSITPLMIQRTLNRKLYKF